MYPKVYEFKLNVCKIKTKVEKNCGMGNNIWKLSGYK